MIYLRFKMHYTLGCIIVFYNTITYSVFRLINVRIYLLSTYTYLMKYIYFYNLLL